MRALCSRLFPLRAQMHAASVRSSPAYQLSGEEREHIEGVLGYVHSFLTDMCGDCAAHTNGAGLSFNQEGFLAAVPAQHRQFMRVFARTQVRLLHMELGHTGVRAHGEVHCC